MARFALLLGLLVIPALLLWLGHRLRDRTPRQRGAFWGGIIGHTAALLVALLALHFPPVLWTGNVRTAIAFWLMCVGAAAGAAIGALRARA
jgi:uncharacterized membrane protein YkvI